MHKSLVDRQLTWVLAHQVRENEKVFAWKEYVLVPEDLTALFSAPAIENRMYFL